MKLRRATSDDAVAIAAIYAPFVTKSAVSFETEAPGAGAIRARMESAADRYPWLAAENDRGLAGYAYATAFRTRAAYRFCVETTVYVAPDRQRQGIGKRLYDALIETLTAQGFFQAIAAIALPNRASIDLHERCGFRHAGTYAQVGWKLGEWHDVGIWQRGLAPLADPTDEPKPVSDVIEALLSRSA